MTERALSRGSTAARLPIHVAVTVGVTASLYAVSLAGVTGLSTPAMPARGSTDAGVGRRRSLAGRQRRPRRGPGRAERRGRRWRPARLRRRPTPASRRREPGMAGVLEPGDPGERDGVEARRRATVTATWIGRRRRRPAGGARSVIVGLRGGRRPVGGRLDDRFERPPTPGVRPPRSSCSAPWTSSTMAIRTWSARRCARVAGYLRLGGVECRLDLGGLRRDGLEAGRRSAPRASSAARRPCRLSTSPAGGRRCLRCCPAPAA